MRLCVNFGYWNNLLGTLFGEKNLLIRDAGEAGELTDRATLVPAVGDDLVLLFGGALEELGDAGEGVLLL